MRVAIVGAGVSGLVAAFLLHRDHDVTVYEAGSHAGGHALTVDAEQDGRIFRVDTGFVVFNTATYPHFSRLLDRLGVQSQPTDMSFSVRCERTGVEYGGTSFGSLFARRRNLLSPSFLWMLREIVRFNREAPRLLRRGIEAPTLGAFLDAGGYSRAFREHYILPMGAALWSAPADRVLEIPASFFVRFFENHGMLRVESPLQWQTIRGGSARYVEALIRPFADRIRIGTPVVGVRREPDAVWVQARGGDPERFDRVILAAHSDQALGLLADPSDREREILGAIPYQENTGVLHTDETVLPRRRRAWASWNYHVPLEEARQVTVTYDMRRLQRLDSPRAFCVSLNRESGIDPTRVLRRLEYAHPLFTAAGEVAQRRRDEIQGARGTYYCGAYWGNGFHEDGVRSAVEVAAAFGAAL